MEAPTLLPPSPSPAHPTFKLFVCAREWNLNYVRLHVAKKLLKQDDIYPLKDWGSKFRPLCLVNSKKISNRGWGIFR